MAGVIFEIDPVSEDAANANLVIVDTSTYFLTDYNDDPNPWDVMRASSADTEGEFVIQNRPTNRTVTVKLRVVAANASALETLVYGLQQKVGKLAREGGTLKKTTPSGDSVVFDVVGATIAGVNGQRYVKGTAAEPTLTFECGPFARGPAVTLSDHVETTLPCLVYTESALAGDVDGVARALLIDNDESSADFWSVIWGSETNAAYDTTASSAQLYYEAESLTLMGDSALGTGPAGAVGGGTNKIVGTTVSGPSYRAVLSTKAAGGAHLTHVGAFRVYARIYSSSNTGTLSVALDWGQGDLQTFTRNSPVVFDASWTSSWRLVDLGLVSISNVGQGSSRWEGRVVASSSNASGDVLTIDCVMLVPTDSSGIINAVSRFETPTSLLAHDEFNQTAGNLAGMSAASGGTWAGTGSTDLTINTTTHAAESSSTSSLRLSYLPTSYAAVGAGIDCTFGYPTAGSLQLGVLARYVDTSNYLVAKLSVDGVSVTCQLFVVAAGVSKGVQRVIDATTAGTSMSIRVVANANGETRAWFWPTNGTAGSPLVYQSQALATGGTLATGKIGILDGNSFTDVVTRTYDNLLVFTPTTDAAAFAGQSVRISDTSVVREDTGGTTWQPVSSYEGDYLTIPPGGREGRQARFIIIPTRHENPALPHEFGDVSARLTGVPRYLVVPA